MTEHRRACSAPYRREPIRAKRSAPRPIGFGRYFDGRAALILWAVILVLLLRPQAGACQDTPGSDVHPEAVIKEKIESRLAEVEAAAGLDEAAKTKLIELYRGALGNLDAIGANAKAAEDFRRTAETAAARIEAIRDQIAELTAPEDSLEELQTAGATELELRLLQAKADLALAGTHSTELEKRLDIESGRPAVIRARLRQASDQRAEIAAQIELPPRPGEGPATAEARGWALEAQSAALDAEIEMLEQELLSQPLRVELLEAERDRAVAAEQSLNERIKLIEASINRARQDQALQARADAKTVRREAQDRSPLVARLAEQNAALSEELAQRLSELDDLGNRVERTEGLARRLEAELGRARETIEVGGLTQELGHLLQRQRQNLPSTRAQRRAAEERKTRTAEVGTRRLIHLEEAVQLDDPDAYLAGLAAESRTPLMPTVGAQLRDLAHDRKDLLQRAIEADELTMRRLNELASAQQRLREIAKAKETFIEEHLLWIRSRSLVQLLESGSLFQQRSPELWLTQGREVGQVLASQAKHSPVFALLAAALMSVLLARGRLIRMIQGLSHKLGKPTTDSFRYTLYTLALTLILAGTWPLLLAVTGWQLKVSNEASDFTNAVGASLLAISSHFYHLRALRLACLPNGLAAAHFRWPESSLQVLRGELDQLSWIFVPAALMAIITSSLDPLDIGLGVGRFSFFLALASLAFALYRLLHPQRGVFAAYLHGRRRQTLSHVYRFGYPLVVIYPVALALLSLMGYRLIAGKLTELLLETLWLLVTLIVVAALARRWLLVSRRRLAYEAAMERREAQLAAEARGDSAPRSGEEGDQVVAEEPEVDVLGLSDRSRKLVHTGLLLYGLFGLWVIWSDVFPALGILDQVTLWHQRVLVDGQEQLLPVTLAGLGLALIYLMITIVLAKQLPAVLEIILLQTTEMSAGSRYTVTTLTNYGIVTAGVVLVFKTLGADWSQLQWLVAALGVGIGFGLQEIIANFVSGIIILFERPIRIGDVVTVGDTDGVVTRIRSRATTIRNWDGKELLVPNKEFITGRLLNWSLSDQATRIVVSVGIAYGSNVRQAMRLLEEAALENDNVLDDPPPSVIFETFGDNSLGLLLRCFVDSVDVRYPAISALNQAINDKFNAAGIVISFPQRDLHLDTVRPLQVELRSVGAPVGQGGAGDAVGA